MHDQPEKTNTNGVKKSASSDFSSDSEVGTSEFVDNRPQTKREEELKQLTIQYARDMPVQFEVGAFSIPEVENLLEMGGNIKDYDPHNRVHFQSRMVYEAIQKIRIQVEPYAFTREIHPELPDSFTKDYLEQFMKTKVPGYTSDLGALNPESLDKKDEFAKTLEHDEGSYSWVKPTPEGQEGEEGRIGESRFISWLNNPDPQHYPTDLKLNCWQAIIVSATKSGFIQKENVLRAINEGVSETDLFEVGIRIQKEEFNNSEDINVARGDVIFIHGSEENWHVVTALGTAPSWGEVPIASHYRSKENSDSSGLGTCKLGDVIQHNLEFSIEIKQFIGDL